MMALSRLSAACIPLALPALLAIAPAAARAIGFDSSHECGNATGFQQAADGAWEFRIEPDTASDDRQWFDFKVRDAAGQTLTFRLLDTNATNVTSHWRTAWPVASPDGGATWGPVAGPTSATRTTFTFTHTVASNDERIAFHYPYSWSDVRARLDAWDDHPGVQRTTIGTSVQGRPIEMLRITDAAMPAAEKHLFWFTARQHAGEVTGSFMVEALIDEILADTPVGHALRRHAVIYLVPMVNPDGVVAGNYRDNAAGVNLNRVWDTTADADSSPEVLAVANAIDASLRGRLRYDFYGDFHGTSGPQAHFAFHSDANQHIPYYPSPDTYSADSRRFLALVNQGAPHFDPTAGIGPNDNLAVASHSQRIYHGALSFTFEGVYNKHNFGPRADEYLTPADHRQVGAAIARALVAYYELDDTPAPAAVLNAAGE